jgi:hypothetical protein
VSSGCSLVKQFTGLDASKFLRKRRCLPLKAGVIYPVKRLKEEVFGSMYLKSVKLGVLNFFRGIIPFLEGKKLKLSDELGVLSMLHACLDESKGELVVLLDLKQVVPIEGMRYFNVDSKGKTIYSPDGSERKAISFIQGTSFAAPVAAGEYLNKPNI